MLGSISFDKYIYMKKGLLIIGIFLSVTSSAQKKQSVSFAKNLSLKKGQQIIITTTATQSAEMTMGMGMKSASTTVNKITVLDGSEKDYKVSGTLTKMLLTSDMMGQQINFDSEKKEDRDSEFGKTASALLDKIKILIVNKITGTAVLLQPDTVSVDKDTNPLAGMMGAVLSGNDAAIVSSAFFIIPASKKAGDKWTDSLNSEGIKTVNIYSIESIEQNIVTIALNTIITGNTSIEAQGTTFNVTMNSTGSGKIVVDSNSFLVKKRTTNADINSTIEMMGQSVPVTGTATTTSIYE